MKRVAYWVCTGFVGFFIGSGGLAYAMQVPDVVQGVVALGFPVHFIVLLGVWKVLGSIAILVPGVPLIKEGAYAGIMFDLPGVLGACRLPLPSPPVSLGVVGGSGGMAAGDPAAAGRDDPRAGDRRAR